MNTVKEGDYVNGHLVEEIEIISGEPHYLITFFQCDVRKPQSLMLAQSKVHTVVNQEDFQRVVHSIKTATKEVFNDFRQR